MQYILRMALVSCLLLFTAGPALAELKVTFVNRTGFEVQSISMQGDGGGMAFTVRVVPGNFCVFTDGNSSELREITIDAGLALFTFTDLAALAGNAAPTLELFYNADNRPRLALAAAPAQSPSGSAPEGASFDLPAGPIWNNDHARERCPQVLEEWLAANPGKQAEWTGHWVTVTAGEMSVCGMRRMDEGAEPPSTASTPPVTVVGKASVFADPTAMPAPHFNDILSAGTMGAIRAMGAQTSPLWDSQVYLPVEFAGKIWAAFVEPEESFAREDDAKPGGCVMRADTGGSGGLASLMQNLAAAGYRPWFSQFSAGEDMDTVGMVRFWKENLDATGAWEQVTETGTEINQGGQPAAVDTILLAEEGYARAADGEDAAVPGFRLRVSNADVIVLTYMPDISMFISMTR